MCDYTFADKIIYHIGIISIQQTINKAKQLKNKTDQHNPNIWYQNVLPLFELLNFSPIPPPHHCIPSLPALKISELPVLLFNVWGTSYVTQTKFTVLYRSRIIIILAYSLCNQNIKIYCTWMLPQIGLKEL